MVRSLEPLAGNLSPVTVTVAPSMAIIPSVKILSVRVVSSVYVAAFAPPTAAITDKASMDLVKVNIVNISYWNEKTKVGQEDYSNAPKAG